MYLQVISSLLETLGWDYVATFYSENAADASAFKAFNTIANKNLSSLCNSRSVSIEEGDMDFDDQVQALFNDLKPKVVVLFLPRNQLEQFFQLTASYSAAQGVQFIVGYRGVVGSSLTLPSDIKIIGVVPSALAPNTTQGFDAFFKSLSPDTYDPIADPWFKSFWETTYKCNLDGGLKFPENCSAAHVQQHMSSYQRHPYVPAVLDSIKVFTEALKLAQQELCGAGTDGLCNDLQQQSADDFYKTLTQVSISGTANQQITFKSSGDLRSNMFSIVNFNTATSAFEQVIQHVSFFFFFFFFLTHCQNYMHTNWVLQWPTGR